MAACGEIKEILKSSNYEACEAMHEGILSPIHLLFLVSTKLTSLANTTHYETTQGLLVLHTYQLVYVVHLSNNTVFSKLSK